jgi:hypothetical protein
VSVFPWRLPRQCFAVQSKHTQYARLYV